MPETGTLIDGKYRILSKLREGGMGAIYKVHHDLLDEIRVIKVMRPQSAENPDLQRRFVQEAQLITRVRHKNICLIFDFAIDDDLTAYIVMEYIEGVSLADWMKLSGPLEVPLALEIARQSLEALEYLHRKRVIHRDISPENIMLTVDHDGRLLVKMIDLGIAKAMDADEGVTKTGVFIGKFKYSSPEQLMSDGAPLDGRTDLYSLGVVLYQLLTGNLPIRGTTATQLASGHLFQPPVPFGEADAGGRIPEGVREIVMKALAKRRDDRHADATAMLRELQMVQAMLPQADLVEAAAFMELVRSTSGSLLPDHPTPTPSAQERLNRRFQPSETPLPMASTIHDLESGSSATVAGTVGPNDETVLRVEKPPKRRPAILMIALAVIALAAAAGTFIVQTREKPAQESPPVPRDTSTIMPESPNVATLMVTPDVTTAATLEDVVADTAGTVAPAEEDAPPSGPSAAQVRATRLRASTGNARRSAESALAPSLAEPAFSRALQAQREGESLFRSGSFDAAIAKFASAETLFSTSVTLARQESVRRQTTEQQNAAAAEAARLEAARQADQRAAAAEAERLRREQERRAEEKNRVVEPQPASQEPAVRSTIQRYVEAAESLDAAAYLAVFPSADRRRIEAGFADLRSQSVSLDIESVEISADGQTATVQATERRVAVPRAGSEQRVGGERTITLSRRGSGWVITRIR